MRLDPLACILIVGILCVTVIVCVNIIANSNKVQCQEVSTMTAQYLPIKAYSVLLYKPRHHRIDFEGHCINTPLIDCKLSSGLHLGG